MTIRRRQLVHKFFADRGTHLAAMVAYFALLSFVPLIFLALSLFGLAHRAEASSFFIRELKHAFPGTSLDSIIKLVRRVQDNAAALGIIGGVGLPGRRSRSSARSSRRSTSSTGCRTAASCTGRSWPQYSLRASS